MVIGGVNAHRVYGNWWCNCLIFCCCDLDLVVFLWFACVGFMLYALKVWWWLVGFTTLGLFVMFIEVLVVFCWFLCIVYSTLWYALKILWCLIGFLVLDFVDGSG
jgi:hypothetical protein